VTAQRSEAAAAVRVEPWLEGAEDDAAWDALCARHDDLFQTSAVTRAATVFGAAPRRVRVLDAAGRPLVAFALLEVGSRRLPLADRLFARRFHVQGGPLPLAAGTDPSGLSGPARPASPADPGLAAAALAGLERFAAERHATETDWKPTWPAVGAALPFAGRGWDVRTAGLAWRTLPARPSAVLASLSRAHRKAVRRAERDGVRVREATGLAEVLALVHASFRRAGLPARNPAFLEALGAGLAATGRATLLVAEDATGPLAALLAARTGDALFNLFHGRVDDPGGASNLLHLRLLERAAADGVTRVHTGDADLGPAGPEDAVPGDAGSEDAGPRALHEPTSAGIRRFKRGLGFVVEPCARGTLVHRPLARRWRVAVEGAWLGKWPCKNK
jgi:hypothetical protein